MTKLIIISALSLISICIGSCNSHPQNDDKEYEVSVSDNKEELANIIDLSVFNPVSVQYVYRTTVKQTKEDRIPGPTDYILEAALTFDDSTLNLLKGISSIKEVKTLQPAEAERYYFSWLDKETMKKVKSEGETVQYSADKFYKGVLIHGSYIFRGNMILLSLFTQ